ncbi:MAG: corrinoid protein [Proteobacteria bacterium]|nr:corrinoid protein [Pseudomonadota bacterium]
MEELKKMVAEGRDDLVPDKVRALLDQGTDVEAVMKQALIPAMDQVGELFQSGEIFLPEMLVAAQAMKAGMAVLEPFIKGSGVKPLGRAVVGTMQGDMHDIGKNLVIMSLEGAGFEVVDLGMDVAPEAFVAAIQTHQPRIVGMSALLSSTMTAMKKTIQAIDDAGLRGQVKIMVGGAPVNREFAKEIGADFYGKDSVAGKVFATEAVQI